MCADRPENPNPELEPPPIQDLDHNGTLRFAVGSPDGRRSQVWSVLANGPDVYAGSRESLSEVKLSLHPAMWRLAYTEEYAAAHLPPDQDRLIRRWNPPPPPVAPGWRHALSVVVTSSMLGEPVPVKAPRRGAISWWPDPGPGWVVSFKVMLGEPQRHALITTPPSGSVGTISLLDGSLVHVIMDSRATEPAFEASIEQRRQAITENPELGRDGYWAWRDSDAVPAMLDTTALAT